MEESTLIILATTTQGECDYTTSEVKKRTIYNIKQKRTEMFQTSRRNETELRGDGSQSVHKMKV